MEKVPLKIAVLSIHSCPIGKLGTRYNGGMSVYVRELGTELGRRGHTVDIYTGSRDKDHPRVMKMGDGVRLIHLSPPDGKPLTSESSYDLLADTFSEMKNFIHREGKTYDLVHSHYWVSGRMGEWAQRRWNLPHILMFHTIGAVKNRSHPDEKEPELRLRVERELAVSSTRILATTETEKLHIVHHCDTLPEKIGVVPCGVNPDRFRPLDRSVARNRLGFARGDSVFLFVGRFAPLKGIDRLVSAVAHLKHRKNLRLILVGGDGPRAPETVRLRKLAGDLGVANRVLFAGSVPQEELPEYYAASDALVIPSKYESFGLVALEALACGTPVLSTPVGVVESLLRNGNNGEIIPSSSPARLAETLDRFLSRRRDRPPSPFEIRNSIQSFHWSNVANAVLQEYEDVLGSDGAMRKTPERPHPGELP